MSQVSCMGFNILSCDTHDCGFEKPADRIRHVIRTIKDEMPDLLGVQEACNLSCPKPEEKRCYGFDWCEPLIKAMDELGYDYSILRDQADFKLERQNIACGLIIFFKKGRFVLNESGCYGYPHDKNRYFQWVKLTDTEYDRKILMTNTHFSIGQRMAGKYNEPAGDAFRAAEAVMLLNFWYKHCDENTALFATGDYNSQPQTQAQQFLRSEHFRPSYMIAAEGDERGTCHLSKVACIIDYCYVNPTAQTVTKYYPVTTRYESDVDCKLAGYPSDHRAIMTFVDYKPLVEKTEE